MIGDYMAENFGFLFSIYAYYKVFYELLFSRIAILANTRALLQSNSFLSIN